MTCSKIIIFVSYLCAVVLALVVIIGSFLGFDMGDVTAIAALAWGEVAASNVFYYKKAAQENVLKISKELNKNGEITPGEILSKISN